MVPVPPGKSLTVLEIFFVTVQDLENGLFLHCPENMSLRYLKYREVYVDCINERLLVFHT